MKAISFKWLFPLFVSSTLLINQSCIKQNEPTPKDETIGAIVFNPNLTYGEVKDIDSNVYKTIVIGSQTWMAQNLNSSHFENGDTIPHALTNDQWNIIGPSYAEYPYTPKWTDVYGKLYNGYAAIDSRNICPSGWHVATDDDWKALFNYLGGDVTVVGQKIQETGTTHWKTDFGNSTGVTNASGFTALPSGNRSSSNGAEFVGQNGWGSWWTSTEMHNAEDEIVDWDLSTYDSLPQLNTGVWMSDGFHGSQKYTGSAIRCVKNN